MKSTVTEHDGCFEIDIEAEDMEEAAVLARMGMNRTTEIRHGETHVSQAGEFSFNLVFGKSKRSSPYLPKRT